MKFLRHNFRVLASERGFTMIVVLGVLLVSSLLMVAAFTAANGDIHLTQSDMAGKRAYFAAQAGISNYAYHLAQDSNYLTYCTEPKSVNEALNPYYKKGFKTPLKSSELTNRAEVPGSQGQEKYAIQLLPAETSPGNEECNKNNVVGTMIEQKGEAAGTFRLQSTGFAEGRTRTIVATFRNLNFVSFVWYSVYETGDSVLYPAPQPNCARYFGKRPACTEFDNYFIEGESVNGPMHTEDHVRTCGKPTFGRNSNDRIEFGNGENKEAEKGYSSEACGAGPPNFKGTLIPPSKTLSIKPPPGDEELEHIAETSPTNYKFAGRTEIILTGETMTVLSKMNFSIVTKKWEYTETKGLAFPPSGVIYVANSGGCSGYSPFGPNPSYTTDSECGNVYVHGIYEKPLTIAAENDVVINGNITTPLSEEKPSTNAMLGLIANNFVRVYHPLTGAREKKYGKGNRSPGPCLKSGNDTVSTTETPKDLEKPEIYAAILAVKHSLIVDNFDCGTPTLGQIKVYGAIAGLFTNGMTGVFSGKKVESGYGYNLIYDNRLQVAEPPHFLNPIQAAWVVQRETLAPTP